MRLQPNVNRLIVAVQAPEERTAAGLYLPQDAAQNAKTYSTGEVLAVAEGYYDRGGGIHPMTQKVGDIVLFPKFGGLHIDLDGVKVAILEHQEILATLLPPAAPSS